MSQETYEWLNQNVLVGMTDKRGTAWHYRASDQGDEPNHYPLAIPVEDVRRRLFDWKPASIPVYVRVPCDPDEADSMDENGMPCRFVLLEDRQAIVGDDRIATFNYGDVLGLFTTGYVAHDYEGWLLNQVAAFVDDDLSITSAGLLKNRGVAWVEIGVPENITTPEGVEFRPNILAATSYDGSLSTTYGRTIQETICDNTMSAALSERGQKIKFRHSRYSHLKLNDVRAALELVHTLADDFSEQVKVLCETPVSDDVWAAFLKVHAPIPEDASKNKTTMATKERDALTRLYTTDTRVAPWTGTAFGVVQAVNTYVHHEATVRGASRPERNMLRAVTGGVDKLDQSTLDELTSVMSESLSVAVPA